MGNQNGSQSEFDQLPDSPTVRITKNLDFLLVTKQQPKGAERLPRDVMFRMSPGHCEFWRVNGNGDMW